MNSNLFLFLLLIFFFISCDEIGIKLIKENINKYQSFKITFDFSSIEENKNIIVVSSIKQLLNKIRGIFSKLFNIKGINKIKSSLNPKNFCNSKITKYNKQLKKGFVTDLLIYPILKKKNKINKIKSKICSIDLENKRPIIAFLLIQEKNKFKYEDEMEIIHEIVSILGFNKKTLKKTRLIISRKLDFYSLRNINEKDNDNWLGLELKPNNYDLQLKDDI